MEFRHCSLSLLMEKFVLRLEAKVTTLDHELSYNMSVIYIRVEFYGIGVEIFIIF